MKKPSLRIVIPLAFKQQILDYCVETFRDHLPHAHLSISFLRESVESTVSDYDQYRNAPWIIKTVAAAARDGVDGVFVDIAFDTALSALKCLDVPVVGALESAVAYARALCRRFAILAINDEEVQVNYRLSREYGFADLLSSVETIDIGVMELREDPEKTLQCLTTAGERAIDSGAQAVILGCTAMSWATGALVGLLPVPILDTNLIGLYMLDTQVRLGLAPSRLEYRRPSGFVELTDEEYRAITRITFPVPRGVHGSKGG
jgi:Asp/Glu/hydantoin racemase